MTTPTDKAPSEAELVSQNSYQGIPNNEPNLLAEKFWQKCVADKYCCIEHAIKEAVEFGWAAHAERVRVDLEGVSRKMRTYLGLYPDDKELRAMIARMEAFDREGK